MKEKSTYRWITIGITTFVLILSVGLIAFYQISTADDSKGIVKFSFPGLDGAPVEMEDYRGKVVLVDVWATWCPPCRIEIPGFIKLYDKYKEKGLVIIGLSVYSEGADVVRPFAEEFKINYPIAVADMQEVMNIFGPIRGIPTTYLINKEGNIVEKYVGYRPETVFEKDFLPLLED